MSRLRTYVNRFAAAFQIYGAYKALFGKFSGYSLLMINCYSAALAEADSFSSSSNHHKKTLYIIVGISSTLALVSCLALISLIVLREKNLEDHYNFPRGISGR